MPACAGDTYGQVQAFTGTWEQLDGYLPPWDSRQLRTPPGEVGSVSQDHTQAEALSLSAYAKVSPDFIYKTQVQRQNYYEFQDNNHRALNPRHGPFF